MSKSFILGIIIFSLIVIGGSYFLVTGGKQNTSAVTSVSYKTTDKEKPKLETKELFKDMGELKVSEQKSEDFVVKNVGSRPLQLSQISSSCGCTVGQVIIDGKVSEEFGMHTQSDYIAEIAAKKGAKIRVTYRPYVMPVYGAVEREVYVTTNDPENPKLVFKVKAYVK
ncbi:hypothetical protein A3C25_04285 [Candidatus Roizmanbacteria bacterium RIFCSPHIGHO2_02_FULL_38_11]|uniref:DUF1573 domain-containing protein n=1 Tax=Candidatus Roizmanbacteria bacterium RIFCSPHIGHO2_02_FULL_38_11 TaxID=1802039 RepID=A0A1F7H285_9BACT|nr:MAG: hypothetical protein A3C25_04285 [Candidatus Roizmanbacteria bacterium RIFCSPHIGHO2_02_FULL_38_11]